MELNILDFGFFINHLQSMGPQQLVEEKLPFDKRMVNSISMRSLPLSALSKAKEEVYLQSVQGRLMLIYHIMLEKAGLQVFMLPIDFDQPLHVIPNYEQVRHIEEVRDHEEGLYRLIHDRLQRSEHAKLLIGLLKDNLMQKSSRIPDIHPEQVTTESFPLLVFALTQLGPTVIYRDERSIKEDWKHLAVVSMIQSNIGSTYEENINLIPVEDHVLLSISMTFRDKQATDKRLRQMSLLQIGLQIKQSHCKYLPNLDTLEEFQARMKEELDIPAIVSKTADMKQVHKHIIQIIRELM